MPVGVLERKMKGERFKTVGDVTRLFNVQHVLYLSLLLMLPARTCVATKR